MGNNTIDNNSFTNIREGVYIQGGYMDDVTHNNFNNIHSLIADDSYGVYLVSSGAFHIDHNTFSGQHSTLPKKSGASYGVVVENSGKLGGFVFDNDITGTDFGIQVQYDNKNLVLRCNTFSDIGTYGIYVYDCQLKQQGKDCNTTGPPNRNENQAGNEWLSSCSDASEIYVRSTKTRFDYFSHYRAEDNSEATIPDCSSVLWKDAHLKVCEVKKTSTSCNSFLPGLPAEPPATPFVDYIAAIDVEMDENTTQINYLKNEIPNVIANTDGGDTQGLITYINDLSNSDGKLKNKLLSSSPLSADALLALLNRAVPLSNGNLQIVLVANSPLPQEVVDAIAEMSLPAGTQNIIDDAQTNDPQYLTLDYIDNQISDLTSDNQLLQNEKVRQKLRNEDEPGDKEVLEQSVLIPSKKALAEELIVKKQVAESRNVIDAVLTESTDLEEDQKFAEIMNTMADLKENGKTIHEMEQLEEDVIRQVANSEKIVAAKAQIVLELAKKEHYPHPILKEDDENKSLQFGNQDNPQQNNQKKTDYIKLYPSPNDGNMMIEYYLPGEEYADLIFYTTEGKKVAQYKLIPSNHKTFINAGDLFSDGMYYYKLLQDDRLISTDKIVIIR